MLRALLNARFEPLLRAAAANDRTLTRAQLVGAGLALFALQLAAFHGVRCDDAYITYRYGQNLANGLGLVWNAGQRVQGSTSPGHMLASALVYALCGLEATPAAMVALGCAAWSLETLALYALLAPRITRLHAAVISLAIGLGAAGAAAFVPLETHWAVACALLGMVAAQRGRCVLAAVSCSLAVWLRPDAALPAGLVLLDCLRRERRRALLPIGVFVLCSLPWPLFATGYYGSPLPQTALAKFQRVDLATYALHELRYACARLLWRGAGTGFIAAAYVLAGVGALRLVRAGLGVFVAYGILHALAYLYLRPFTQHTWHLYPWTLGFCVCAIAGILPPSAAGDAHSPRRVQALRGLCLALCIACSALAALRFADEARALPGSYWSGQRDAVYRKIARHLRARAEPGDWFASVEVGTIGYFSGLPAYDLGGLVTRADDPLASHRVRFLVVDKLYLQRSPPTPPSFVAKQGSFFAHVYDLRHADSRVSQRAPGGAAAMR